MMFVCFVVVVVVVFGGVSIMHLTPVKTTVRNRCY